MRGCVKEFDRANLIPHTGHDNPLAKHALTGVIEFGIVCQQTYTHENQCTQGQPSCYAKQPLQSTQETQDRTKEQYAHSNEIAGNHFRLLSKSNLRDYSYGRYRLGSDV
jgi:hypothetical protein